MRTKTIIQIELAPFDVPNVVSEGYEVHSRAPVQAPAQRQQAPQFGGEAQPAQWCEPHVGPRTFNLSELSDDTLHTMCDDFRREVFKRAGRPAAKETAK